MKLKVIAVLLAVVSFCTSFSAAGASDIPEIASTSITTNEADFYLEIQESSDETLQNLGYSKQEIEQLREVNVSNAIMERAKLDDDILYNMGYSSSDIEVLRAYSGEPITPDSAVYAAMAQVTGLLVCKGASTSAITFEYQWEWDKVPVANITDSVALRWKAYNSKGQEISVSVSSSSHSVNYRSGRTLTKSIAVKRNSEMQGASSSFERSYRDEVGDYLYAMDGKFRVRVKKDGSDPISYIKVARAYAHVTVTAENNPTITAAFDGSFNISFSPISVITKIDTLDDDRIIRINSNGSVVDA